MKSYEVVRSRMKSNEVKGGHVRSGVFYNMTDLRLEKAAGQKLKVKYFSFWDF